MRVERGEERVERSDDEGSSHLPSLYRIREDQREQAPDIAQAVEDVSMEEMVRQTFPYRTSLIDAKLCDISPCCRREDRQRDAQNEDENSYLLFLFSYHLLRILQMIVLALPGVR
jgi:hypothetical protein